MLFLNPYINNSKTESEKNDELRAHERRREVISNLAVEKGWRNIPGRLFQGFWFHEPPLSGTLSLRDNFRPAPSDLFIITFPKSGTTWLKALAFAICNRSSSNGHHSLMSHNPQDCYPNLENLYANPHVPDLDAIPSPRMLATHIPYSILPESVRHEDSPCRIIYLCREPKDTLVSTYHYINGLAPDHSFTAPISMEEAVGLFCKGQTPYGPVWEHQLEYWRESRRRPDKVLFLKYEDIKAEPEDAVRRLANFMGSPFSAEEESNGMVSEIVQLCSFKALSGLEVNKTGVRVNGFGMAIKNSLFFRKGEVGDWREHLSPKMAEQIDAITKQKLLGTGLIHCLEPPGNFDSAQGEHMP